MDINESFRSAYSALVSKPAGILPFYFLSVSVPAVIRVAPIVTGVLVYLALLRRGHADEIGEILAGIDIDVERIEEDPEAIEGVTDELAQVGELILVPEVIGIIAVSAAVFLVLALVLNAAVGAGQVHAIYSTLTGDEAVADGVDGIFEDTWTFLLLLLIEVGLILAATTLFLVVGVVALAPGGALAVALGALLVLFWLAVVLVIHTLFIFAPQSVVVQNRGAFGAVRGNVGFIKTNPVEFIAYVIFVFAAWIGISVVTGLVGRLGAPAATLIVTFLIFSPFVGVVKTDLFTRHADGDDAVTLEESEPELDRAKAAFRHGWDEMVTFTRSSVAYVGVAAALFFGTAAAVWYLTAAAGVGFETSISERLAVLSPIGAFVNYATNNWSVAVAQSYAGFAFGIPTVVSLVFNGGVMGFLTATEANLVELAAFVVPHGVIEIPALLISGALGIHLGVVSWRYYRGRLARATLADEVSRTYYILLGLAVLFVAAAVIEAFVSPYYYGPLLDV